MQNQLLPKEEEPFICRVISNGVCLQHLFSPTCTRSCGVGLRNQGASWCLAAKVPRESADAPRWAQQVVTAAFWDWPEEGMGSVSPSHPLCGAGACVVVSTLRRKEHFHELQAEEVPLKVRLLYSLEQNALLHHPILCPEKNGGWQLLTHLVLFKDLVSFF